MRGRIPAAALHGNYKAEDFLAEARDVLVLVDMALGDGGELSADQVTAVMLANIWALHLVRSAEERLETDRQQRPRA